MRARAGPMHSASTWATMAPGLRVSYSSTPTAGSAISSLPGRRARRLSRPRRFPGPTESAAPRNEAGVARGIGNAGVAETLDSFGALGTSPAMDDALWTRARERESQRQIRAAADHLGFRHPH